MNKILGKYGIKSKLIIIITMYLKTLKCNYLLTSIGINEFNVN